ncbi:hypothetical protein PaecuDRAFT_4238 [Paenibacillus curdlanolyticus YK9]|uniref:Uncharacterized protein n=1 Tax=Paenibacillus curdlanolyticus YK9 TaxID=717606 RepID=E0IEZ7_9BACL|nr:hypothetical protein PaecuDRAFT_4238 [Paenibacillus curdlanolyticus YK9]
MDLRGIWHLFSFARRSFIHSGVPVRGFPVIVPLVTLAHFDSCALTGSRLIVSN